MSEAYGYSDYNDFNRFQNLEGLEAKIVDHLVNSHTKHAEIFWKILKYNDLYALSQPAVSIAERWKLVCNDNGDQTNKRLFFKPFIDDAWQEQCSSVYIYVETINPVDHLRANIGVTIETVTHSKICAIAGDGDRILNPDANPNDSDAQGNIVVAFKNRATVLLKCVLAELNGLYLDGIGYLQFNSKDQFKGKTTMPLWNNKAFYGHSTIFMVAMSGMSDNASIGY